MKLRLVFGTLVLVLGLSWTAAAQTGQRVQVTNGAPTAADNSTNSTTKVPVLPCVATAAAPSWTEGKQVPCSTDLAGNLRTRLLDPCSAVAKTVVPFSISSATTTQLAAASSSNHLYVCAINIGPVSAAANVALVEDDTSACASPTAGMAGGTSAASGWNFDINGGLTFGNGLGTVAETAATNRYVCFITSSTAQVSGTFVYALAP